MKTFRYDSFTEAKTNFRDYCPKIDSAYFVVEECRTGTYWITPLRGNALMDLETRVKHWIKNEFCGEFKLDSELMPGLQGDYYAFTVTDGRAIDSGIVWESGGFYIKENKSGLTLRHEN